MNKKLFAFMLLVSALPVAVQADELQMPPAEAAPAAHGPSTLPKKGASMAQVRKQFGEPQTQHPAVGGGSPKQPPITRWDYAGFSVFFEDSHVVDAVVPGQRPQVHHVDQLKPAQ